MRNCAIIYPLHLELETTPLSESPPSGLELNNETA